MHGLPVVPWYWIDTNKLCVSTYSPAQAKEAADRVRVLSVYQEMGMLVTMQGSDDDEARRDGIDV